MLKKVKSVCSTILHIPVIIVGLAIGAKYLSDGRVTKKAGE